MKSLFCLDFDSTIPLQHLYDLIIRQFRREMQSKIIYSTSDEENAALLQWSKDNEETIWQFLNGCNLQPISIQGGQQWQQTIQRLIEQEHQIAIVSFNPFLNIIKRYLKEIIGLSADIVDTHIIYDTLLPENPSATSKNNYIQRVHNIFLERNHKDPEEIFLIDDSQRNISSARQGGYRAILATPNGQHFYTLEEIFKLGLELPADPHAFLMQTTTSTDSIVPVSTPKKSMTTTTFPAPFPYMSPTAFAQSTGTGPAKPMRQKDKDTPQMHGYSPYTPPTRQTTAIMTGTGPAKPASFLSVRSAIAQSYSSYIPPSAFSAGMAPSMNSTASAMSTWATASAPHTPQTFSMEIGTGPAASTTATSIAAAAQRWNPTFHSQPIRSLTFTPSHDVLNELRLASALATTAYLDARAGTAAPDHQTVPTASEEDRISSKKMGH